MNYKFNLLTLILINTIFALFFLQETSLNMMLVFWMFILILTMIKNKNHFISLLLILEMMSMSSIFMMGLVSQVMNSTTLMFILMTLSVGEAVLGLAILVKLIRWSSSEFIMSGLN